MDPNLFTLNAGNAGTQTNSTLNSGPYQNSLYSLFGRVDYAFKDKYLLSGTLRRDGSSIFAQDVRFGYFPSFTVGWRVSQEDFMKGISWLNDLKIRGGWGKLGSLSNAIATNQFTIFSQLAANSSYDLSGTSTSAQLGSYNSQLGNPQGTWEQDKITNIGFDASIFNHLDLSIEYYNKSVTGLLFKAATLYVQGGANPSYNNVGNITNHGIDASLTYHGGTAGDFKYDITGSFTSYKNKVVTLGPGQKYLDEASYGSNRFGAFSRLQPGQAVGAFYGYKVVGLWQNQAEIAAADAQAQQRTGVAGATYQPDEAVGRFRYADENNSGNITDSDRAFIGNPNPKWSAGLNISVSYKGFDVSAFFYANVGNDVANYVKYWTDFPQVFDAAVSKTAALHSFGLPGANGKTPILERSANSANTTVFNSYYLENGSYLRCKQLSLGYSLPPSLLKRVGVDRFRIYVQVANLFTITKYSGLDPELQTSDLNNNTNFGIDFGNYPGNQKNYNVGVQLGF